MLSPLGKHRRKRLKSISAHLCAIADRDVDHGVVRLFSDSLVCVDLLADNRETKMVDSTEVKETLR